MAEAPKKKVRWIKKAVAHPGAFKEKAEKAGDTTAPAQAGVPGKLGKEARLAETLMGLHHGSSDNTVRASYKRRTVRRAG